MLTGLTSTPTEGATDWIAPNWPVPEGMEASRRTAARVMRGASSLSSSSHFPLRPYSNCKNPVALPPGRARLSTNPPPTGSGTMTNTMGTVRVSSSNDPTVTLPFSRMTSGAAATSSAACLRIPGAKAPAKRTSIARLRTLKLTSHFLPLNSHLIS